MKIPAVLHPGWRPVGGDRVQLTVQLTTLSFQSGCTNELAALGAEVDRLFLKWGWEEESHAQSPPVDCAVRLQTQGRAQGRDRRVSGAGSSLSQSLLELVRDAGLVRTESSWNRTVFHDQRPSSVPASLQAKRSVTLEN